MKIKNASWAFAFVLFLTRPVVWLGGIKPKALKVAVSESPEPASSQDSLKNTLVVGLAASNNSYFFGRSTEIKYPYLTTDVTYKFKSGIWLSAAVYNIFHTASLVDETDLSAGYNLSFTDRLSGSLSYARYIYGPDNPLIKSAVSNIANGNLGLDWSYLYTSVTASYIFGGSQDIFISLNNSRYFEKKGIFAAAGYLGIEPMANLLGGTQVFTQTYTSNRNEKQPPNARNPRTPVVTTATTKTGVLLIISYRNTT